MMKNIKNLFLLFTVPLLLLSFSNCGGAQNNGSKISFDKNPPFKIADAYYQKWVAGVSGGGSGINVFIIFSELEPRVKIKSVYFRNHKLGTQNSLEEPEKYIGYLKNDSPKQVVMDSDPLKEANNRPPKSLPFKVAENDVVICYFFNGTENYYKISNLSQKEMIAYPQVRHNE